MKQEKIRSEIDKKYQWNINRIYQNEEEFQKDYKKLEEMISYYDSAKGHLLDSTQTLQFFLEKQNEIDSLMNKLHIYAYLLQDTDINNSENRYFYEKIRFLIEKINLKSSYVNSELLQGEYETIQQYIKENPKLEEYEYLLKLMYYMKEHVLSETEERVVAMLTNPIDRLEEATAMLRDSELEYGTIIDEDGEEIIINGGTIGSLLNSHTQRVRKEAYQKYYGTYQKYIGTFASHLIGSIEAEEALAKLHKFSNCLEQNLYHDEIDSKIFTNLLHVTNQHLETFQKVFQLRQKVLHVDELHTYDIDVDLYNGSQSEYTVEETKKIILNGLSILGEEYGNVLKQMFEEQRIDWFHNKGKSSGFYNISHETVGSYVLANFDGKFLDVTAIGHELGHAVHGILTIQNQPYQYQDPRLFVCEIASLTNEFLICKHIIETGEKEEKKEALSHMIGLIWLNYFITVRRADFEHALHEKISNHEVVTADTINKLFCSKAKQYYQDTVIIDDVECYRWASSSHYYCPYYTYKYAVATAIAIYTSDHIINHRDVFLPKYQAFLKSGNSMKPTDELRLMDIDLTNTQVFENLITVFEELLNEYEALLD